MVSNSGDSARDPRDQGRDQGAVIIIVPQTANPAKVRGLFINIEYRVKTCRDPGQAMDLKPR
jgi:hypothetical protein